MDADKILVIDEGSKVEEGNHEVLSKKGGKYEALIKN